MCALWEWHHCITYYTSATGWHFRHVRTNSTTRYSQSFYRWTDRRMATSGCGTHRASSSPRASLNSVTELMLFSYMFSFHFADFLNIYCRLFSIFSQLLDVTQIQLWNANVWLMFMRLTITLSSIYLLYVEITNMDKKVNSLMMRNEMLLCKDA